MGQYTNSEKKKSDVKCVPCFFYVYLYDKVYLSFYDKDMYSKSFIGWARVGT